MALLFWDSFDHYATADITKKWTSANTAGSTTSISSSAGRRSGGAMQFGTSAYALKTIPAAASFVMGGAFYTNSLPNISRPIFTLQDSGSVQCDLRLNTDLTLSVTRNGTALTNGTSTNALTISAFYYIEWKVTIADSIGAASCVVKVNGVPWITVATGQDTKSTANASANQIVVGPNATLSGPTWTLDDFYICDQSGSGPDNDFLGDCRIDCEYANGDGSNSDFTCSTGSTHYTLVDEATPNTSDYVESSTVGHKDTWQFQNLSAITGTIFGVQVCSAALKDDAGARSIANTIKSGSTNADGATQALSTSQLYYIDRWMTDPNTGAAWTEANFNAAEFGVKVAA
jgi:hypothetical protein